MQAELGDEVINDGAFHGLVDEVVAQMAADAALAEAMARAVRLLLARAVITTTRARWQVELPITATQIGDAGREHSRCS